MPKYHSPLCLYTPNRLLKGSRAHTSALEEALLMTSAPLIATQRVLVMLWFWVPPMAAMIPAVDRSAWEATTVPSLLVSSAPG